jgi:hypothetical protein
LRWAKSGTTATDLNKLYSSTQRPDRNGFTAAGRALQKHANRPGSPWASYKPSDGPLNPSRYNQIASGLVRDILFNPNKTYIVVKKNILKSYAGIGAAKFLV